MAIIRTPDQAGQLLPAVAAIFVVNCFALVLPAETHSAGDAELFVRLDANKDGVVSAAEVASENRRLFERLVRRGDANGDKSLSRDELVASLVPTRPEKPIEPKQPAANPQADAVRYLLLTMDANRNSVIEPDEVPKDLERPFEFALDRLDANKNGRLDRFELGRGGPAMAIVAARYVERERINVKAELAKLEKTQGDEANRFDEQPMGLDSLRDPKKARQLFAQFDQNADGQLERKEVPEPLRQPLERFMRLSDRDRDGRLSQQEFLDGADRLSKFLARRDKEEKRDLKAKKNAERAAKPDKK
jgi:Ca2+-binding EF-hand superfamily protein